jgi:hypothetical protein
MNINYKMSTTEQPKVFESPPESISINEVAFMHQIIQACAQRGAFKPDEFKDIGVLNDKLKSLIEYAKSLEEKAKNSETDDKVEGVAEGVAEGVDEGGK